MKKLLLAIVSLAVLVSCQKESISEEIIPTPTPAEGGVYEFDIQVVSDSDFGSDSKAVKSSWQKGDRVLLFFQDKTGSSSYSFAQNKYAVLICTEAQTGQDPKWRTVVPDNFSLNSTYKAGNLSAIYIPNFSLMFDIDNNIDDKKDSDGDGIVDKLEPKLASNQWTIPCGDVYYSCSGSVAYNVTKTDGRYVITANNQIPLTLANGFVQFYVTGISAGDYMACDQIESYNSVQLGSDMTYTASDKKSVPVEMRGYDFGDNAGTVFYGKLKSSPSNSTVIEITHDYSLYSKTFNVKLASKQAYKISNPTATATSGWTKNATDILPRLFNAGTAAAPDYIRFARGNMYCTRTKIGGTTSNPRYSYSFALEKEQYYFRTRNGNDQNKNLQNPGYTERAFFKNGSDIQTTTPANTSGLFTCYNPTKKATDYGEGAFKYDVYTGNKSVQVPVPEWGKLIGDGWSLFTWAEARTLFGSYSKTGRTTSEGWNIYQRSTEGWCNLLNEYITVSDNGNSVVGVVFSPNNCDLNVSGEITPEKLHNYERDGIVFLPCAGILHQHDLITWMTRYSSERVTYSEKVDDIWVAYWTGTHWADGLDSGKYNCAYPIHIGNYLTFDTGSPKQLIQLTVGSYDMAFVFNGLSVRLIHRSNIK